MSKGSVSSSDRNRGSGNSTAGISLRTVASTSVAAADGMKVPRTSTGRRKGGLAASWAGEDWSVLVRSSRAPGKSVVEPEVGFR